MKWCVYGLVSPVTGKIRYVGHTVNLRVRLRDHGSGSDDVNEWMRYHRDRGRGVTGVVLEPLTAAPTWQERQARERHWIEKLIGEGATLFNVGNGGVAVGRTGRRKAEERASDERALRRLVASGRVKETGKKKGARA